MADLDLPFTPADHDLRVDQSGYVYYVRAVRRGVPLSGGGDLGGDLLGMVVLVIVIFLFGRVYLRWFERPFQAWLARRGWKVGVLRLKADRWGITGGPKVVHRELVSGTTVPAARLAELADEVRAGKFAARGVLTRCWNV